MIRLGNMDRFEEPVYRHVVCRACNGKGYFWDTFYDEANDVDAEGQVVCVDCEGQGEVLELIN